MPCYSECVEVGEQLAEAVSRLPYCGSQGSNSAFQDMQQVPVPDAISAASGYTFNGAMLCHPFQGVCFECISLA